MFTLLGELPLITINVGNVHLALYQSQLMYLLIAGDPVLFGMPLFKALIGAALFTALWYLLTYRMWHHRRPYYQRRVPA